MILSTTFATQDVLALNMEPLKVVVGSSHVPVFDEQAPIQGLITFQNIVLGQLLYATDSYTVEPGMLKVARWDFQNKYYELELRTGIKFHNGREANAKDLEFSITRGLFSKKYSWVRVFLSNIKGINDVVPGSPYRSGTVSGIKITGPRTLKVYLAEPNPAFLLSLGRATFALVPQEELMDDLYTWKTYPIGAGLYKITSVDKSSGDVCVQKIDKRAAGPNEILFTSSGIGHGEDLILVDTDDKSKLERHVLPKATSVTGIFFNFDNPLAQNADFRLAMSLLVSRTELVTGVPEYKENTEILAHHQYGRAGIKEHSNPSEAKRLLEKIKGQLPKGVLRAPVFNSGFGKVKYGHYLDILVNQFSAVGLKVEFFDSPKKFFDSSDAQYPIRILSPGADPADPLVIFNLFKPKSPFSKHAPQNDSTYENLIREAANAESLDIKAQSVQKLSRYVLNQHYFVPLFERLPLIMYNPKKILSLGEQDGGLTFFFDRLRLANAK